MSSEALDDSRAREPEHDGAESRPDPTPASSRGPAGGARGSGGVRAVAFLLTAVCVALAVAVAVLGVRLLSRRHDQHALDQARTNAIIAARQELLALDAISATTYDKDVATVLAGATGQFKTEAMGFTKASIKQRYVTTKRTESGAIVQAGVVRADEDTATLLLADDHTIKDTSTAQAAVLSARWRMNLEKHGGRWLVAGLEESQ